MGERLDGAQECLEGERDSSIREKPKYLSETIKYSSTEDCYVGCIREIVNFP